MDRKWNQVMPRKPQMTHTRSKDLWKGLKSLTTPMQDIQVSGFFYTTINIPLSIYHYQYTIINIPLSIYHYQYTTINIPISIYRHEIFPEFSGIPEFSGPQRSFLWKSQIRFNIYGGGGVGGYHIFCVLTERQQCWNVTFVFTMATAGTARHKSSQVSGVYTLSIFTSRPIL